MATHTSKHAVGTILVLYKEDRNLKDPLLVEIIDIKFGKNGVTYYWKGVGSGYTSWDGLSAESRFFTAEEWLAARLTELTQAITTAVAQKQELAATVQTLSMQTVNSLTSDNAGGARVKT